MTNPKPTGDETYVFEIHHKSVHVRVGGGKAHAKVRTRDPEGAAAVGADRLLSLGRQVIVEDARK